ncbi:DUF3307 domain-containing protein [Flavobacterium psychrophilum]|nr:DUF3307 domain-containing protein [Flavobacterium psychrophilum]EKT4551384.1 DUF3307 domain-containing protein [Flavobacterium psychrophilum]ELM3644095.1 DUF3307 domain-containing protein [Flavobacterium psychrophilum]OJH11564.1 hypothetical protein FPG87_04855 [Flavobacterium psychrophilum]SNA67528.1 conserved membrane hypothetical protein [Flavobacterium psychrophilum]
MMVKMLILQIIAHILSDYFFQTDASAKEKNENGFKSQFLLKHTFITFICSWLMSFDVNFVFCALSISIIHYIIDGLKKSLTSRFSFFIDQSLHLVIIGLFVWIFDQYFESNLIWNIPIDIKWLAIILGYLICVKPANIFIRETFVAGKIESISDTTVELKNAGKLIGILERILVLTFVIIGKLEVVGFLIAAKSILRYKDTNTIKTEYVLIGTMLSFGIAMMIGLLINKF